MRDGSLKVIMLQSVLPFAKLNGVLLGFGDGNKQRQKCQRAYSHDFPTPCVLFFHGRGKSARQKKPNEKTGDQASQMRHVVNMAFESEEQIQQRKPENVPQQAAD